MILSFPTTDGGRVAINPALVVAVEPVGDGAQESVIRMGHGLTYLVKVSYGEVFKKLDF